MQPRGPRLVSRHILLTGRPGIGKTTVIERLAALLQGRALAGFCTRELRENRTRVGFEAVTFSGRACTLAHTDLRSPHRVGRYAVDIPGFEGLVLPELARACEVMLIDEIGKMECFSARFVEAVRRLLDGATPVVATLAASGGGFIAEVRARPDAHILEVRPDNRDELPGRLAGNLSGAR
jgi:nucleoside-triphosphatase